MKLSLWLKILLLAIGLTVLTTWPFLFHLTTYYSDFGDYPLVGWILWYNTQVLKSADILKPFFYFSAPQLYPYPLSLARSDHMLVPALWFAPIFFLTKHFILSVNIWLTLTFILSFVFCFYFVFALTHSIGGAVLGAIVYTFNPLTFSHFPMHANLLNKYFLPLVFLFAYRYIEYPRLKTALLFSGTFMLNALSVFYFQIFTLVMLPIFLVPILIARLKKEGWQYLWAILKTASVGVICLLTVLYWDYPYLRLAKEESLMRSLSETREHSATLLDWFSPDPRNIIYNKLTALIDPMRRVENREINYAEHTLFVNLVPILILISGFSVRKQKCWRITPLTIGFAAVLVFSILLTFGPGDSTVKLLSPYYYIYRLTPFFNGIRATSRFQFLFYIPLSLMVAMAWKQIEHRLSKSEWVGRIFLLLIILLLVENIYAFSYQDISDIYPQVIAYQKMQPQLISDLANKVVLHLPVSNEHNFQPDAKYLTWSTITQEKLVNGYTGNLPVFWRKFITSFNNTVSDATLARMKSYGVNYLIVHKNPQLQTYNRVNLKTGLWIHNILFEDEQLLILKVSP